MPHSPAERKRALTRVRRVRGQFDTLEKSLEQGADQRSQASVDEVIALVRSYLR